MPALQRRRFQLGALRAGCWDFKVKESNTRVDYSGNSACAYCDNIPDSTTCGSCLPSKNGQNTVACKAGNGWFKRGRRRASAAS